MIAGKKKTISIEKNNPENDEGMNNDEEEHKPVVSPKKAHLSPSKYSKLGYGVKCPNSCKISPESKLHSV